MQQEVQQIACLIGDFSVTPEEVGRAGIRLFLAVRMVIL